MNRSILSLSLLLALSSAALAQPQISDKPILLSELATVLQKNTPPAQLKLMGAAISGALTSAPTNGASPILLSGAERAKLGGLVQAALAGDPQALQALDHYPGWNIPDVGKGLSAELAKLATTPEQPQAPTSVYEKLGIPVANQRAPQTQLKPLGNGLFRGSVFDPKKVKIYADSARLAEVFNRLSMHGTGWVAYKGKIARTPRGLLGLLARDGHTVTAHDHRAIANFVALYFQPPGQTKLHEVVAPLWLDTRIPVPNTQRTLLVPATHSEMVFEVRGPVVNANVAFYLGTDNQATFRPNAGRDPSWVGGTTVRHFKGRKALSAATAASWVRRNMGRLSDTRQLHKLQSGAYGQLGVCNDATALVEALMGLEATHWPLVRLREVYQGTGNLQKVSDSIPYDTDPSVIPSVERAMNSIPFTSTSVPDLFPTLRADMQALAKAQAARQGAATVLTSND
jgi:hypothetical protein